MTEIQIHPISILPFGMLNAFLLHDQRRAILVDTGLPGSARKIAAALHRVGLGWQDLSAVVVTHGHIDHAGSVGEIRKFSAAPVIGHAGDLSYFLGKPPLLQPSGAFGALFRQTGLIQQRFDYFTPDLIMEEEIDLSRFGFPGRVLHTPGHTPGSLSLLLPDGAVIAGDLLATGVLLGGIVLRGRPKPPPFEEDRDAVMGSLARLLSLGAQDFYLGHGGPIDAEKVRRYIEKAHRIRCASSF